MAWVGVVDLFRGFLGLLLVGRFRTQPVLEGHVGLVPVRGGLLGFLVIWVWTTGKHLCGMPNCNPHAQESGTSAHAGFIELVWRSCTSNASHIQKGSGKPRAPRKPREFEICLRNVFMPWAKVCDAVVCDVLPSVVVQALLYTCVWFIMS